VPGWQRPNAAGAGGRKRRLSEGKVQAAKKRLAGGRPRREVGRALRGVGAGLVPLGARLLPARKRVAMAGGGYPDGPRSV
jgi:hypothetical protein